MYVPEASGSSHSDWMAEPSAVEVRVDPNARPGQFRGNVTVTRRDAAGAGLEVWVTSVPLPDVDSPLVLDQGLTVRAGVTCFERTLRFIEPRRAQLVQQTQRVAVVEGGRRGAGQVVVVTYTQLAKSHAQSLAELDRVFAEVVSARSC